MSSKVKGGTDGAHRQPDGNREIYMDNAATSYPKPAVVEEALMDYHRNLGASAGRGAYPRAVQTGRLLDHTRKLLASLFNVGNPNQIIFSFNTSDALNLAIKGIDWHAGDSVIVSAMEHNSILRPLHALKNRKGIKVVRIKANAEGVIDPADVAAAVDSHTKLIALVHGSNVTGTLEPVAEVGDIARRSGIPFLVDAAQTAGALPIDVEAMKVDLLAFPGHKALMGPLGTGALYIREGIDLDTMREGGTGSLSEHDVQPDFLPDRYEAGSHNALGIAGWKAALEFVHEQGVDAIRAHEEKLMEQFLAGASHIKHLTVFGPRDIRRRIAVFSVRLDEYAPQELSHRLFEGAGLMTRSGLHCAPGAHQTLETYPLGTTRLSFGYFNTPDHVDQALAALDRLSKNPIIAIR
ncbi:MAG TPA: aminotransferase class V-fold PLP-dependent enzyme [Elusimicrobiota bacterium]|nr:aminotransferase class V-fold PLP-dependent enzyme [Elusimicrobiota bacterium]